MPVSDAAPKQALAGLRVLDLSRVLAGPWCTQILADLGAEVLKIEQPGAGDDTRRWGPPFVPDGSNDAAYYLCANRNKRALQVNLASPEGAALIRRLAAQSDVVVENFRFGGLEKYGLDYASLSAGHPELIYCSITGFGQTGPDRGKGGYDFLIQGISGLMSVTGRPDGSPGEGPLKAGIPVSDLATGLYATIAILAALNHRKETGMGQHVDVALLDCQMALLANQASNWLNGGLEPRRLGNEHPNTVPYQDFESADGPILVAIGNDNQFRAFCDLLGRADLASDIRFASSGQRSVNRLSLQTELAGEIVKWPGATLLAAMDAAKLPGGRVRTIPEALDSAQVAARGLVKNLVRDNGSEVRVVGFPVQMSATPASYHSAPPRAGSDTNRVLAELLELNDDEIADLARRGIVSGCAATSGPR